MTLTVAWVRKVGQAEEMIIASDSRLRSCGAWDAAPKIVPLPRQDAAIAFAGETDYAYPIMLQVVNSVGAWSGALDRRQTLPELRGHIVRVINLMLEQRDLPKHLRDAPEAFFLLAGYDWKAQDFSIWTLHFDSSLDRFTFRPAAAWRGGHPEKKLAIVGDKIDEAHAAIVDQLRTADGIRPGYFDLEPMRVLAGMIDSDEFNMIGGHIQVVKVYKSLQCIPFVVSRKGERSLLGRPLLAYEISDTVPTMVLDF